MVTLETIKGLVEIETGIKDIGAKVRDQRYVDARVMYYVLARERAKVGYARMAELLKRNHATALHSYRNIYAQWKATPKFYSENLQTLRRIEDTLDQDVPVDELTAKKLYVKYRTRNALLYKENAELRKTIKVLEKKVEELKKYEPIW